MALKLPNGMDKVGPWLLDSPGPLGDKPTKSQANTLAAHGFPPVIDPHPRARPVYV
jgi:hypothetical protein